MSNLQKRKLKVLVGPRQRARRVRQFVDEYLDSTHGEEPAEELRNVDEVSNGTIVSLEIVDAAEVSSENNDLESEVESVSSNDSELELSGLDFDGFRDEENCFGSLGENEVADNDSDVDEADDWDVASEADPELSKIEFQKLFKRRLCHWAVDSNVPRESVNKLLRVLKTDPNYSFLPQTYKTLLGTPRKVDVIAVSPGWYHGFCIKDGIVASLNSVNAKFPFHQSTELSLLVGCDGTSVGSSTNSQFWPIIGKLCLDGTEPFDIGFYQGNAKPNDVNSYLKHFCDEMLPLINDGFRYNGCHIKMKIKAFCCDAPACSFIKNVKPCGSYFGCMKCETEGEYVHNISGKGGRVTYPEIDAMIRTDESFRDREQIQHHAGFSILESLPIDMVKTFCIDPMHLVYMGAARKLLFIWVHGRRTMKVKLSWQMMKEISDILVKIEKLISVEFERKTRTLDELSRFKATELRLLLVYILPIILKNRLPDEVYQHFLLLHVAIRILSCKESVKDEANVDYANSLLVLFIEKSVPIYGDQFLTYNIHNLQHLGEECKQLGSLEMFSCFAFENHIGKLKNLVRKSAKPLQQLVNRTIEIRCNPPIQTVEKSPSVIKLLYVHNNGRMLNGLLGQQFSKVCFKELRLSCRSPNNCVVMKNGEVVLIENFVEKIDGQVYFLGKKFLNSETLYDFNGLDSKFLGTQIVHSLSLNIECWNLKSISAKALKIPIIHNTIPNCFGIATLLNFDL